MYPVLDMFGYKIGSFPVCVGIGLASGVFFIFWQLKKIAASPEHENLVMIAIPLTFICGTIGAHCTDVILHAGWKALIKTPLAYGLTFYGWLLTACIFLMLYSKKCHISSTYMLNLFCPAFAIAQAWGRIGCFLGGCCFGMPGKYGVIYPPNTLPYIQYGAIPLIPVQLYESVYLFVLFFIVSRFISFQQRIAWYFMLVSAGRFGLEFFRADNRGVFLNDLLSPSQWISTGIFIIGIIIFLYNKKRKKYACE